MTYVHMPLLVALAGLGLLAAERAHAAPADLLSAYTKEAGTASSATRGEAFFTQKHGKEWSCTSCHGTPPTKDGAHAITRKRIAPLAPAFNAESLQDMARAEKWLKRNCGDVVGRACTPAEKADVVAYLMSLK